MARDCNRSERNVFDANQVSYNIQSQPNSLPKMLKYSIFQVSNSLAVPEVCKDLVRSLCRDYRVYSIQSKDSKPTTREIVLSVLSAGAN